jgi:tripartite-type tricarboxylate transporter receptor subunit TctC
MEKIEHPAKLGTARVEPRDAVRAGTPAPMVARLHQEVANALRQADVAERASSLGLDLVGSTPDEFAKLQRDEIAKWGEVIRSAKIKVE